MPLSRPVAIHDNPVCREQTLNAVLADLATRLGVSPKDITAMYQHYERWPNTSLGNPKPGMFYAQVIVPGYSILLSHAGQTYEYHTDLTGMRIELVRQLKLQDSASAA